MQIVYNEHVGPNIFARYIQFSLYTITGYNKLLAIYYWLKFSCAKNFSHVILDKILKTVVKLGGNFSKILSNFKEVF